MSGFTKFFTKLGGALKKAFTDAKVIEPLLPHSHDVLDVFSRVIQIVSDVEVIGQTLDQKGPQKLQAAAPLVGATVLDFIASLGHEVDENQRVQFTDAINRLTSATVDIVNTFKS